MPPTGFEPVISALRGQRPKPLDDEGTVAARSDDGIITKVSAAGRLRSSAVLPVSGSPAALISFSSKRVRRFSASPKRVCAFDEVHPHLAEIFREAVQFLAQAVQVVDDLQRALFDLQAPEPLGQASADRRKRNWVRPASPVWRSRRRRGPFRVFGVAPDDRFVIDVFGRDIHEREREGSLLRADVALMDVVDVLFDVADEFLARRLPVLVRSRLPASGGNFPAGIWRPPGPCLL